MCSHVGMDAAEREFVKEHEAFVRKLASRVLAQFELTTDLEDLVAYGYRGLLEARARFDPSRGVPFASFAHYRVRGAILDGVRQMAYLPRRAHEQRKAAEALDRAAEEVAMQRAADPAARADAAAALAAMDEILGKTCAAYVISVVGQSKSDSPPLPDEEVIALEAREQVSAVLDVLDPRERALISGHYFEDRTLEEIGAEMGISKSWASRLHSRALGRLREALAEYRRAERGAPG